MAYTAAQVIALQEALASGELTVKHDNKVVTYRSVAELERALATVQRARKTTRYNAGVASFKRNA